MDALACHTGVLIEGHLISVFFLLEPLTILFTDPALANLRLVGVEWARSFFSQWRFSMTRSLTQDLMVSNHWGIQDICLYSVNLVCMVTFEEPTRAITSHQWARGYYYQARNWADGLFCNIPITTHFWPHTFVYVLRTTIDARKVVGDL